MVLKPFNKKCFFADSSISFDDKRMIILRVFMLHGQPLLNHEKIFFQPTAFFVLIEAKHNIGSTNIELRITRYSWYIIETIDIAPRSILALNRIEISIQYRSIIYNIFNWLKLISNILKSIRYEI